MKIRSANSGTLVGQTKQFQGGSNAIGGFPSCFPPASTPASFALPSPTQVLRYGGRLHQQTRFEIPGDQPALFHPSVIRALYPL